MSANEIPSSPTITHHYRSSDLRSLRSVPLSSPLSPFVSLFSAITNGITPFSIVPRVARVARSSALGSYYHGIVSVPPPLPFQTPKSPFRAPLPSPPSIPPAAAWTSETTTVVQRELRIRPKCIGSCGRVLFPFNRANAFRITFRETAERSASHRTFPRSWRQARLTPACVHRSADHPAGRLADICFTFTACAPCSRMNGEAGSTRRPAGELFRHIALKVGVIAPSRPQ